MSTSVSNLVYTFLIALVISTILVPLVMKFAKKIGAVDQPNKRKVHKGIIPRIGGLAIYGGFLVAFFFIDFFVQPLSFSIILGATIIAITGFLDDKFNLRPWQKIIGQLIAAVIVLFDGLTIQYLTIPFTEQSFAVNIWIAFPISLIWLIGITNAVNLIDGLDGLAGGVSAIAASAVLVMALIMGDIKVALLSAALIGSTTGFLFFNFNPAKIFMGDTGSLLLGFLLGVFSIIGFKQVTFVTMIIPILILAVPIIDTGIAIIRRKLNNRPIMDPDKNHLHHKLLDAGFSHKQAVLFIYSIAAVFGTLAVALYDANLFGTAIIFVIALLMIELLIESLGLINKKYRPLLNLCKKMKIALIANSRKY